MSFLWLNPEFCHTISAHIRGSVPYGTEREYMLIYLSIVLDQTTKDFP